MRRLEHCPQTILLSGPPGTGKSTLARELAQRAGLPYALCCGGDFIAAGQRGPAELDKIFRWANQRRRGMLLFIDEAEAFLRSGRDEAAMDPFLRASLSKFLSLTGTDSKVSVVLATNLPNTLDKAILDRVDDSVRISLPTEDERAEILRRHFAKQVWSANRIWSLHHNKTIMSPDFIEYSSAFLARLTSGMSGRQLEKLAIKVLLRWRINGEVRIDDYESLVMELATAC